MNPVIEYDQLRNGNDLKKWYNKRFDEQMKYLMITNLLNKNEIISDMIHLTTNHCCRYVDPTFSLFWAKWNPDDNK